MDLIPSVTHPMRSFTVSCGVERAVFHELCAAGDHEAVDYFLKHFKAECDSLVPAAAGSGEARSAEIYSCQSVFAQTSLEIAVSGRTPLQTAAQAGMPHIVRRLLNAGAVEDYGELCVNDTVERAMAGAVTQRTPKYLRAMLDAGADPNGSQTLKIAPLLACCRRGVPHLRHVEPGGPEDAVSITCAEMLLAAGAEPNVMTGSSTCPLLIAARKGCMPLAQMLLDHGAAVRAEQWPPLAGVSLLGTAARFNKDDTSMLELLLRAGALPVLPVRQEPDACATELAAMDSVPTTGSTQNDQSSAFDDDGDDGDAFTETLVGVLCVMGRPSAVALLCEQEGEQYAPVHPGSLQDALQEADSLLGAKRSTTKMQRAFSIIQSVLAVLARRDAVAVTLRKGLQMPLADSVWRSVQDRQLAEDVCDEDGVLSRPCSWRAFGVWDPYLAEVDAERATDMPAAGGAHHHHRLDLVGGAAAGGADPPSFASQYYRGLPSAWDEAGTGVETALVAFCISRLVAHHQQPQQQQQQQGGDGCTQACLAQHEAGQGDGCIQWWCQSLQDAAVVAASILRQQTAVLGRVPQPAGASLGLPWAHDQRYSGVLLLAARVNFARRKHVILRRRHHMPCRQ